ncbi:MAG: hypothetical protein KDB22_03585 [Planctomycetales bacterium]|nr:hypothetical protein [Planctomycetales bacterium]
MRETTHIKFAISVVAANLLVAHLIWPDLSIDAITVVLAIVAILPWLATVLERATFPGGWEVVFREVKATVEEQQEQIEDQARIIDDLVIFSMAHWLFYHLRSIYYAQKAGTEYIFNKNDDFVDDLRFLRDNGYLEILGIRQLEDGTDLAKSVKLTPIGSYYVELREKREKEIQKAADKQ